MRRWAAASLTLLLTFCFVVLGIWQLERRIWKHALIARIESRISNAPVQAPGPDQWPLVSAENAEYLHVSAQGRFLANPPELTKAVTAYGPGSWVMAPFQSEEGWHVLINRGFVPDGSPVPQPPGGDVKLTGLLRISEPAGGFLRRNDPLMHKWYSRDVAQLSVGFGLAQTAPYFIDLEAGADTPETPRTGLTVVNLPNNHMIYAMTWFIMACGALLGFRLIVTKAPYAADEEV